MYIWSLILDPVCMMHVFMIHIHVILNPWSWYMYVWCIYLWCGWNFVTNGRTDEQANSRSWIWREWTHIFGSLGQLLAAKDKYLANIEKICQNKASKPNMLNIFVKLLSRECQILYFWQEWTQIFRSWDQILDHLTKYWLQKAIS